MYSCTFSVNSRSCISSTQTFVESVTVQDFYRNLFTGEIFLFSLWLISWPLDFQDETVLPKFLLSFLPIPPTRSTIVSVRTTKAISQRCWILTYTIWFGRINIRSLALSATRFRDKLCGIHWYSKCAEWSTWIWKLSSFFFFFLNARNILFTDKKSRWPNLLSCLIFNQLVQLLWEKQFSKSLFKAS